MDASVRPAETAMARARFELNRGLRAVVGSFRIRDEHWRDLLAREALLDRSCGPERFGKTCERLREGRLPAEGLSFVAVADGEIVGTLRFWHVEAGRHPSLMLGPLAIDGRHRAAGIGRPRGGRAAGCLRRAARLGHDSVILVGDAPYYGRFDFSALQVANLTLPGPVDPARFLGLELVPGALTAASGRVVGTGLLVDRLETEPARLAA